MHDHCSECGLKYEREGGYFLGSIYINYGLTALSSTFAFLILKFGFRFESRHLVMILLAYCCTAPFVYHRFARSLWLAFDCFFDWYGGFDPVND